jgi:hypothetical protein
MTSEVLSYRQAPPDAPEPAADDEVTGFATVGAEVVALAGEGAGVVVFAAAVTLPVVVLAVVLAGALVLVVVTVALVGAVALVEDLVLTDVVLFADVTLFAPAIRNVLVGGAVVLPALGAPVPAAIAGWSLAAGVAARGRR